MIVKSDYTRTNFTEWLLWLASRSSKGSYLYDAVLEIPRAELIKKSDYLFDLLDDCYDPETVTEDLIRELICYNNWGAPDYNDDGTEFEW